MVGTGPDMMVEELSHQPAVHLLVGNAGVLVPREVPSILSCCQLCSHCVSHWLCLHGLGR